MEAVWQLEWFVSMVDMLLFLFHFVSREYLEYKIELRGGSEGHDGNVFFGN